MRLSRLTVLAAFVVLANGSASAQSDTQSDPSGFGIGGRYTYVRNLDSKENANMGGIVARLRGHFIGVEGAIDYRAEDLPLDIKLRTWPVSASLLVFPVPILYGLAGIGWYNTTVDFPDEILIDDETDSVLGYHVGGGLEIPVSPNFRLTSDVRWLFVDYEFKDIPDSIGDVDANSFTVNAGVLYYFL